MNQKSIFMGLKADKEMLIYTHNQGKNESKSQCQKCYSLVIKIGRGMPLELRCKQAHMTKSIGSILLNSK